VLDYCQPEEEDAQQSGVRRRNAEALLCRRACQTPVAVAFTMLALTV